MTVKLIAEIDQHIMMNLNLEHILNMFLEQFKILLNGPKRKNSLIKLRKKQFQIKKAEGVERNLFGKTYLEWIESSLRHYLK